jgi:tRNA pseudouridine38-40 synthase
VATYRLELAYDGSRFHGYARQPDVRTVQGDLEAALAPWTGGVDTFVAGRTDRGVHASGQVVSFTCDAIDTNRVMRSLNTQLSPEVAVLRIVETDAEFHARFSATGRSYRYVILNTPVHDPLRARIAWNVSEPLDVMGMNHAVQCLVGEHDFAAFCRRSGDTSLVRLVRWAGWGSSEDIVELSIGATSFCHQMVRSIVAVSVEVGRGRMTATDVREILDGGDRSRAKGTAPAHGLTLVSVSYGDEVLPRPDWIPDTS